ncbi:MAG TPA: metal ABC transporter permease [Candidatus Kapabacteria bacterium]|nr:metal ABC transporter permease [Candidatus Kapabacteria bacterium]
MTLIDILRYDFLRHALIAGMLISLLAPIIGTFLVVRRYSYMADTLAHISLVGVAVAFLFGFHPVGGAVVASILAAVAIEELRSGKKILSDSLLAIFLSGSLAVAVVLISAGKVSHTQLMSFLFGSITTVTVNELWGMGLLTGTVLFLVFLFRRQLFLVSFDEEIAQAEGMRAPLYNILLVILAGAAVGISIRIVGALLIGALMVIPVMAAIQFGRRFRDTILLAVFFSFLSTITGLILSYILDVASGGMIVICALLIFCISLLQGRE